MITYRKDFGRWWPNYDHKPEVCFSLVMRNLPDMNFAINACKHLNCCVQAGGHAGLWPEALAKKFLRVYTFEPEPALYSCMEKNVSDQRVIMSNKALGAFCGPVMMRPHVSAGSWSVQPNGTVQTDQITIDSLNLKRCDALFLDIEGYEPEALKGAAETILKHKPIIHIEMLKKSEAAIRPVLKKFGYGMVHKIHKDEVWRIL